MQSLFKNGTCSEYKCIAVITHNCINMAFSIQKSKLGFSFSGSLMNIDIKVWPCGTRESFTSRHSIPNASKNFLKCWDSSWEPDLPILLPRWLVEHEWVLCSLQVDVINKPWLSDVAYHRIQREEWETFLLLVVQRRQFRSRRKNCKWHHWQSLASWKNKPRTAGLSPPLLAFACSNHMLTSIPIRYALLICSIRKFSLRSAVHDTLPSRRILLEAVNGGQFGDRNYCPRVFQKLQNRLWYETSRWVWDV